MGVKLPPPPRLYSSELAKSESRRTALLLVELDTEEPNAPRAEPNPTPKDPLVLLKPREVLGGGAALVWEKSELLWELGATEPEP